MNRVRLSIARFFGRFCVYGDGGGVHCACRACNVGYWVIWVGRRDR